MYNKPRGRLTLTRETNLHTTNSLASLQIVPTVSSSTTQNSAFSRHTQQFDKSSVQPQEQVIFRPTQIFPSDVNMKRFSHQGPPDFTLNQFAEKVPIHFRSNKKQIVPAAACAHDLTAPPDIVQDVEDSGRSSRSSSHLSPNTQKAPAYLPGDRVIFAESPSAPGIPVVYRTPEERQSNPDRLNLDRRKLSVCPILEGEEQLRLLNYQHNMINKIQHLSALKRLIFLDLYDNQIEEISGLNSLKSLRVLMLGKNRIRKIENLDTLLKLDVLDLHGNQISNIEHLTHLSELRVLNLAGNQIVHVDNLAGMDSLAELNLRRNKIKTVVDVENLPSLQRLFLSFNDISSFEDIACLGESTSLTEISLDGNPIAQEQYYKQIVLRHMQNLKQLDLKKVTDVSLGRRTQHFNPLYQLMSMPGLRSGLANTQRLAHQKPGIRPSASEDLTSIELDEKIDNTRLSSGKPQFLMVRATDWAVNTTVNSKSQSTNPAVVQKEAILSNKTGMATTKPAYSLVRSYTSVDDFRSTRTSSKGSSANFTDPLCPSPMFSLNPVNREDDLTSELPDGTSSTSISKTGSIGSSEKDEELKEDSKSGNASACGNDCEGSGDPTRTEDNTNTSAEEYAANATELQNQPDMAREDGSDTGKSQVGISTSAKPHLKVFDTAATKVLSEKIKLAGDKIENAIHENESILNEIRQTKHEKTRPVDTVDNKESKGYHDNSINDNKDHYHGSKMKGKSVEKQNPDMKSRKTAWVQSSGVSNEDRPGSEHLESRRKENQLDDKVKRPSSEHKTKKSIIESVLQGLNVFKKDSKCTRLNNPMEKGNQYPNSETKESNDQKDKEDAKPPRPVWKVVDNKIVKMACSEREIMEDKLEIISNMKEDMKNDVSVQLPGMVSATDNSVGDCLGRSGHDGGGQQNVNYPSDKYDISITRNFCSQSSGVDQVTMIIPRSPNSRSEVTDDRRSLEDIQNCEQENSQTEKQIQTEKVLLQKMDIPEPKPNKDGTPPLVKLQATQEQLTDKEQSEMLEINTMKRENHLEKLEQKLEREKTETHKMLRTSHSLPNLWKSDSKNKSASSVKPEKKFLKISQQKEQHEFTLKSRPDNLIIYRESPIQGKPAMQTIPESEQILSPTSTSLLNSFDVNTRLLKSASAPALSSLASPGGSQEHYGEGQIASPKSPSTPTETTQPIKKNSGTTMGQSVVKQSYKNTPLMLTCSAVVPAATPREDEKRVAFVMARKEEEKKKDLNKTQIMKEKKRLAINNARRQWEVMQGNMITKSGKLSRTPDLYANHVGSIPNSEFVSPDGAEESLEVESVNSTQCIIGGTTFSKKVALVTSVYSVDNVFPTPCVTSPRKSRLRFSQSDEELSEKPSSRGNSRPSSSHSSTVDLQDRPRTASNTRKPEPPKNLKETIVYNGDSRTGSDLNHLADLEGDTVTFYGTQSLEALDRNWGMQASAAVTHIIFKFIDFEDIAKHLYKVRTKFPGVQTITFSATNIRSYQQINALSSARRFDNLIVENEGNPITKFTLWRSYVVFRLAHFALKKINDMEVTAADIVNAEKLYGPVSHITTSQLPQSRLLSLVGEASLMSDPNYIKMNLAYVPKKQHTMQQQSLVMTSREATATARNHIGELTKAFAAINTSKIEIRTKPPIKRSYSVTPTSSSQGLKYPNGMRPSPNGRLQKHNWHSTNDLTFRGSNDILPSPKITSDTRFTIQNDILPSSRLPNEVIAAAKKIQSEVLASTHFIKPDIEQKTIQYSQNELVRRNYAEQVYRKLTASEDGVLQKSAYFHNSVSSKLGSGSNSALQKQAFTSSQQQGQKSNLQSEAKQSVTLKLISVQSAEDVTDSNQRKQVLSLNDDKSKKLIEGKLDKSQNDFVGRAGLTHHNTESISQKQQEQSARRNFARSYVNEITKEAIFTDRKRNELLKQWPVIFHEMVYSAVTDMSDMQSYMKKCLEDLEKS